MSDKRKRLARKGRARKEQSRADNAKMLVRVRIEAEKLIDAIPEDDEIGMELIPDIRNAGSLRQVRELRLFLL